MTDPSISRLNDKCASEWEAHWKCLEMNNQEFMPCRKQERPLNKCVLDQLNLVKSIPGSPAGKPQIHEKTNPVVSRLQK